MSEHQLDLFSGADRLIVHASTRSEACCRAASQMCDEELVTAIPESSLTDSSDLAMEAGRRRLAAAVPALAALCRRLTGYGAHRPVPEQVAAIEGLAMIGSRGAAHAVSQMIEKGVVQGPTLQVAVGAAARLRAPLSADTLAQLLRHAEPAIRADS